MLRILAQNQAGPIERAAQYPLFLQLQALVFDRAHLHLLLPEKTGDDGDRQRRQQQRHDHRDTALPVEPKNFWPGTRWSRVRFHTAPSKNIFSMPVSRPRSCIVTSSPVGIDGVAVDPPIVITASASVRQPPLIHSRIVIAATSDCSITPVLSLSN